MDASDANIFQSSLVPLRLKTNVNKEEKLIWQNPMPSSPRYCRPIRVGFVQETNNIIVEEIDYVENQIKSLKKTEVSTSSGVVQIKHLMALTMVDAKVYNAATATSSTMRCYICKETSKDFNSLQQKKEENLEALKFGLSTLHARIRLFESLLHLSYKLPIRKWQIRCKEDKETVCETKRKIQAAFKKEMGLLVDLPKPGLGNTNDGNTARRFFEDIETSARITGLNVELVRKFKIIIEAISSGCSINIEKFSKYALETGKLYVELYGWHPMTPTMHKILIHGATVISHAILPIGQLSEEAAEHRNKHFREYRRNFTRKFSRIACNRDIINRLLISSDPFITSCKPKTLTRKKLFSSETLELLIPEKIVHTDNMDN